METSAASRIDYFEEDDSTTTDQKHGTRIAEPPPGDYLSGFSSNKGHSALTTNRDDTKEGQNRMIMVAKTLSVIKWLGLFSAGLFTIGVCRVFI